MKIKGKYKGNKNVRLDVEPNIPIDTEVFVETRTENELKKKNQSAEDEYFLLKIAKMSQPASRTDYSETYHEILYGIE